MKKILTEELFKNFIPKEIYSEACEDYIFGGFVHEGEEFLAALVKSYFKKNGECSPFVKKDFTIDHTIQEEFAAIRIRIRNGAYSTIQKVYVVFKIANQNAVERAVYLTELEDSKLVCTRINVDGSYLTFDRPVVADDDESQIIFSDYVGSQCL